MPTPTPHMSLETAAPKLGLPAALPVRGMVLAGRFEVLRPLGRRTLLGRDDASAATVVIRAIPGDLVSEEEKSRVERRVAGLRGLPGSSTAGPLHCGRDGAWFIVVTPFVHGVPLDERLGPGGLGVEPTIAVGRDLLRAVSRAHEHGLGQLEIRPSNVIVNPDGRVRSATVVGFGGAILRDCLAGGGESPLDVAYAAPERVGALDRPVDLRADLYAVGLVLHECLTGRPVHVGETEGELLRRRLTDRPGRLSPEVANLPAGVETEILRMLELEPSLRPSDATQALGAFVGPASTEAADPTDPADPTAASRAIGDGPKPERPGLVGRDRELGVLIDELGQAASGRGGAILVEGPAGRGKTRLLDELCGRAAADGAIVLRGRAKERPAAPAAALEGMPDVIERQARIDPTCAARLLGVGDPAGRAAVCRLLPVLSATLAAHWGSGQTPAGRWSRAQTLAETLAAVGTCERPAVVVLDDCQWADEATIDLITTWAADDPAGEGRPRCAVLVAAYRPEGLAADHPLRELAAVRRIGLGQVGSPPAGVGFDQLPDDVRRLLGAGAVLGGEFDPQTAAGILGRGETWGRLTSGEARRREAVRPSADGEERVVFADDELRRAAVESVADGERRRLHARAADALAGGPGDHVYEIADQAIASGDPERATRRALAAGRAATGRGAADVAERYLRAAHRYAADGAPELELEIAERLAGVQLAQGRADLAAEQLSEAARIAREPGRRAGITAALAGIEAGLGDPKAAVGAAEAALTDLGGRLPGRSGLVVGLLACEILSRAFQTLRRRPRGDDIDRQAAVYNLLASLYTTGNRRVAGAWAQLRALRLAESQKAGRVLVDALSGYARLLGERRLRLAALTVARRALASAETLGDGELAAGALSLEGELLYAAGNPRSAAARFGEAAILLRANGDLSGHDRSAQAAAVIDRALLGRGYCEYRLGRLEDARATAAELGRRAAAAERGALIWAARGLWLKAADGADAQTIVRAPAGGPAGGESGLEREARALELLGSLRPAAAVGLLAGGAEPTGAGGTERAGAGVGRPAGTGVGGADGLEAAETLASSSVWLATGLRLTIEADTQAGGGLREAGRAARRGLRLARRRRTNLPQALRELGLIEAMAGRTRLARWRLRRSLRVAVRQSAREEHARTLAALDRLPRAGAGRRRGAIAGRPAVAGPGIGSADRRLDAGSATRPFGIAGVDAPVEVVRAERPPGIAGVELSIGVARVERPVGVGGLEDGDERVSMLLSGARGISSATTDPEILEAVEHVATGLLGAGRTLFVEIDSGAEGEEVSGYSVSLGEGRARVCRALGRAAARQRRAVAVSSGGFGVGGLDAGMLGRAGVGTALCAPIVVSEIVTRCLYVERPPGEDEFGPQELRLADFVAGMAGAALERAEGFARVANLQRSLEERVEGRTAQLADSNRQLDLSLQRLTEAFERERDSAAALKHQAFHDPLTDLANRALFVNRVEHAIEFSRRHGHGVAVLFVDLDDFKTINDSLGHPAGDELLVGVAERLREVLRSADTAARLGGDEFGILLEGVSEREGAVRTAERIIEALDKPFRLVAKEVFIHASIGIALYGPEEETVEALLRNADVAMYFAKSHGKHGFEVFEQRMHDEIVRRLELKDDLHRGIELEQFAVHYQPIVDISTGHIHGLEALIRWHHPEHGLISPLDFVPLAEETGMIRTIGDWVLRTATHAARGWQNDRGPTGERLTIGVNLSARELHEPGLVGCVHAALGGSGLRPVDLTLEITESVLMHDTKAAIIRLNELKELGVRLAIDDFGTGYSSLSYLKDLPVDIVKIAKPFVDDIADSPQEAALAGAIVTLSETLNLKTVAEGIEYPAQLRALQRLGCDYGQGYLFAKAIPETETGVLLGGDRQFAVVGSDG
ncbi:MAG TPA: EAL domain-containing protein [Solirubrobacteraceae bacterium]